MEYSFESMLALLKNQDYFSITDVEVLTKIKTNDGYNLAHALLQLEMTPENQNNFAMYSPPLNSNNPEIINFFLNYRELFYQLPNSTISYQLTQEGLSLIHEASAKPAIFTAVRLIDRLCRNIDEINRIYTKTPPLEKQEEKQHNKFKLDFYAQLEFNHEDSLGVSPLTDALKNKRFHFIDWAIKLDKKILTQNYERNKKIIEVVKKYETTTKPQYLGDKDYSQLFYHLLIHLEKENMEYWVEAKEGKKTKLKL
jgi:hypothetical protein